MSVLIINNIIRILTNDMKKLMKLMKTTKVRYDEGETDNMITIYTIDIVDARK